MSLQETIIQQLGVKPVIDAQEEIRRSSNGRIPGIPHIHPDNIAGSV